MKRLTLLGIGLSASFGISCAAQPPEAQIQNKQLHLKLYLPDAKDGFYKGTRFDWSGVIFDLEFAGHHLYQPWFTPVDPTAAVLVLNSPIGTVPANSAMSGPVEEFQTPVGYQTAKPGENFLKIGVGLLQRADDKNYSSGAHYDIVDGGKWTVHKTATSITFEQTLGGADSDYGYVYTKTIRLLGDTSSLVIEHSLKNTGKLPITSKLYDHNFLTIDGEDVGAGFSVSVPYKLTTQRAPDTKLVKIDGSTATFIVGLHGDDKASFGLQGFSSDPKDYNFTVLDPAAKIQINIAGDRALNSATIWSFRSLVAIEPFINIQADPGKEANWSYTYTYSPIKPTDSVR